MLQYNCAIIIVILNELKLLRLLLIFLQKIKHTLSFCLNLMPGTNETNKLYFRIKTLSPVINNKYTSGLITS